MEKQKIWMPRTDLALELTEGLEEREVEDGIFMEICQDEKTKITETMIRIENEKGAKRLGKPMGTYLTMEGDDLSLPDENYHEALSRCLAKRLKKMVHPYSHLFVVGLGNHRITSDSLGPSVVENLFVNRHLQKEGLVKNGKTLSAFVPGVMGQTGIEAGEILKGVVEQIKPDVLLVIDALAAKNVLRLHKTIQLCDTGIVPGSGVGNHRKEITEQTMGIPVLSMGVPTVVSVPTIVNDVWAHFSGEEESSVGKLLPKELAEMYVTPKNIDEAVKKISFTISEAIHRTIYTEEDMIFEGNA